MSPWPFTATSSPGVLGKPPWSPPPGWELVPRWGWGDPGLPRWWQRAGNGNAGSGQGRGEDGWDGGEMGEGDKMGEGDMGSSKGGLVGTALAAGWGWSRCPELSPQPKHLPAAGTPPSLF